MSNKKEETTIRIKQHRIENLDYLRGFAALGILIYHYLSWTLGAFNSDSVLGRIGIYGVSMFYILSGVTLFYVYYDKMEINKRDILDFVKKRYLRIMPLFILITFISIYIDKSEFTLIDLLLNCLGIFGFIKWDTYFVNGAWSIGNEMVFYLFFIFLMVSLKKTKSVFITLALIILFYYIYFAFFILTTHESIGDQWKNYVNPLNQVFLFLCGFLIGLFYKFYNINPKYNVVFVILGLLTFVLYPVSGDRINIVTSWSRLIFTLSCVVICLGLYNLPLPLPKIIRKFFSILGDISYSLYLTHGVFYSIAPMILIKFSAIAILQSQSVRLLTSFSLTVISSYILHTYFEKYFINLGKTKKIKI